MMTIPLQKRRLLSMLRTIYAVSSLSLLSLTVFVVYNTEIGQWKAVTGDKKTRGNSFFQVIKFKSQATLSQDNSYFCVENILDQRLFRSNEKHLPAKRSGDDRKLTTIIPEVQCKLLDYSAEHVTSCLDILQSKISLNKNNVAATTEKNQTMLHFVFIGDSRIRQQFLNFLKIIPEYDRTMQPNPIPPFHHGQISVNSSLLKLRVSFHWQPVINNDVVKMIRQWIDPPNFIFLSMAVHHMIAKIDSVSALQLYQRDLSKLSLVLSQIASVSQVVWINQYPTVDFFGEIDSHNTAIHSEKVHGYNKAARRIIENHKSITLWDSSNRLAEEYVRGCVIFSHRASKTPAMCGDFICDQVKVHEIAYRNCKDYIHTGYVALSQATQFLFNDICNKNFQNSYFVHTNARKKTLQF